MNRLEKNEQRLANVDKYNQLLYGVHGEAHQALDSAQARYERNNSVVLKDYIDHEAINSVQIIDKSVDKLYKSHKDELHELALRENIAREALKVK